MSTPEADIYIGRNGESYGPFSREDCVKGLLNGQLFNEDLAWAEGHPEWKPLHDLIGAKAISVPTDDGQWNVQVLSYSDPRTTTRIAA
jgi:hypothetical protein